MVMAIVCGVGRGAYGDGYSVRGGEHMVMAIVCGVGGGSIW